MRVVRIIALATALSGPFVFLGALVLLELEAPLPALYALASAFTFVVVRRILPMILRDGDRHRPAIRPSARGSRSST